MATAGLLRFLKGLTITGIVLVVLFVGVRALVGTTGIGYPFIDVLLVPDEWFVPDQVYLTEPATVTVTGSTPGALWDTPVGERDLAVSGSTMVLSSTTEVVAPVAEDGTVRATYTFAASDVEQAAGWRVIRMQQVQRAERPGTAYVMVDLTRRVWLVRTSPVSWREVPVLAAE